MTMDIAVPTIGSVPRVRRIIPRSVTTTLSVALTTAGFLVGEVGCGRPTSASPDASLTTAPVERVTAGRPARKTLRLYTSQPGRVAAFEETPIFSKLTGYVESVLVDIGDTVIKGEPLVRLWIPELQDELRQTEALVAQAEAGVSQAEADVQAAQAAAETAQAKVAQAEAGVGRAEGEFERWQGEYARIKELAANGSVTKKLADETLNQFRAAEAARQEASANVKAAQAAARESDANISKARADHGAASARLRVAQANLARGQTILDYTQISAPFAGVVTRRGVDTGHYVYPPGSSSNHPLLVVARTDTVRVQVDVPELEAALVTVGDPAAVRVQALGSAEFEAVITRTSWSLDTSNRSLRAEIDVPNPHSSVRPGMYAQVTILLDQRENVLTLPVTALVREGPDTFCCRVSSGKIERRRVELGLRSGDEIEVLSGLDENHVVVLARPESLRQGQAVEVITSK
jgi:RND family efflux transporter MFP subunit